MFGNDGPERFIDLNCCHMPPHVKKHARDSCIRYSTEGSANRFNVVNILTFFLTMLGHANANIVPAIMQLDHSTVNAPFCAALGMTKYGIPTKHYYSPQVIVRPLPIVS
jgi:hypothetical protein